MTSKNTEGWEPPQTTLRLVFEDGDWAGAEIVCIADVPFGTILTLAPWEGRSTSEMSTEDLIEFGKVMRQFGDDILVSWNLTHKGEPRPATGDGFLGLGFIGEMTIFSAWFRGIQQAATPLVQAATSTSSVNGGGSHPARSSKKAAA